MEKRKNVTIAIETNDIVSLKKRNSQKMKMAYLIVPLIIIILFLCGICDDNAYAYTNHSQSEAVSWIQDRKNEGWAENYDGRGGSLPQCVDLIVYYFDYLAGYHLSGNGYDYVGRDDLPSGWYYTSLPSPGDIAVWGANKGIARDAGHVALVLSVGNGTFNYVDVNGATGRAGSGTLSNSNPSSFIHPDFDSAPFNATPNFHDDRVSNISSHNATISTWVANDGIITEMGFYLGSSDEYQNKIVTNTAQVQWTDFNLEYDLNNYYGMLSPGATYTYVFYVIKDGIEYHSPVKKFTTGGTAVIRYGKPEDCSSISDVNAHVGAWFWNDNAKNISSLGVLYGTSLNSLSKKEITKNVTWTNAYQQYAVGDYAALVPGTRNYVRLYADCEGETYLSDYFYIDTKAFVSFDTFTPCDMLYDDSVINIWARNPEAKELNSMGFYLWSDDSEIQKFEGHSETVTWTDFNLIYSVNQFTDQLEPSKRYCYRFYVETQEGVEYQSPVYSFVTSSILNMTDLDVNFLVDDTKITTIDGIGFIQVFVDGKLQTYNGASSYTDFCQSVLAGKPYEVQLTITNEDYYYAGVDLQTENYYDLTGTTSKNGTNIRIIINKKQNHTHIMKKTGAIAATCTDIGNSAYWTCTECGKYFSDADGKHEIEKDSWIILPTGHNWGEWAVVKEATATEDGMEERVCLNDPTHKETRPIEKKPDNRNGLYNLDGKWKYYENGVFTKKTGIVQRPDNRKYYYVDKGVYKKLTGLAQRLDNKKWYYVENGVFSKKTGVVSRISDSKQFYVKAGVYDNTFTGLAKGIGTETQYFIQKGKLNNVTGLYNTDGTWRYFEGGVFTEANGIVQRPDNGKYYYVDKGVYKKSTGLAQRLDNKKWYYVEKGIFSKKTGAAKQLTNGKWYYVQDGKYTKSTGLAKRMDNNDWYYFKSGSLDSSYDGKATKIGEDGTLYDVAKGKMVQ